MSKEKPLLSDFLEELKVYKEGAVDAYFGP